MPSAHDEVLRHSDGKATTSSGLPRAQSGGSMKGPTSLQFRQENGSELHPRAKRLAAPVRRAQVLQAASEQFAKSGFSGTSTVALARAAGVTKPVLYEHFDSKKCLFTEAVEASITARLGALDTHLASIAPERHIDWMEGMAEATVASYASGPANAVLMAWALLELPEQAVELHRREVSLVQVLWDRELARRFPASPWQELLSVQVVPRVVGACLAYGFWLSTFRPSPGSVRPLVRQFSAGIAEAVCGEWTRTANVTIP
jgi:AcrR family transcriptional regulator